MCEFIWCNVQFRFLFSLECVFGVQEISRKKLYVEYNFCCLGILKYIGIVVLYFNYYIFKILNLLLDKYVLGMYNCFYYFRSNYLD